MAVQGKKKVQLYVDAENYQVLKDFVDTRPHAGGISEIVDKYIARCASVIRKNPKLADIEPGKLTVKKFFKLAKLNV